MVRRSLREKWQPNNLKDYQVKLNHYNVTSYFFTGAFDKEPTCYEDAKGCQKWEIEMQDEIDVLRKNDTWELVPKPESNKPVIC